MSYYISNWFTQPEIRGFIYYYVFRAMNNSWVFYYMVNSTFPLDFVISLNSKREMLLFHKYTQQTVSWISEHGAAEKQLWVTWAGSTVHSILENDLNYVPEFLAQCLTC